MKNLVIVESPSKSKTIEKYLGEDYEVVSSKGHIRDLAIKGKEGLGVDVDNNFEATYSVSREKSAVVKDLKARAKKADYVYLATDPDREGEAISWHLAKELNLDLEDQNRVVFNEITKDAVLGAFEHPRTIDMDLVRSQETRRIVDRIIGFKLSKLLQSKIKSKSAGRVQSVALKLIVEREKEINAFIQEEYWTVHANFEQDGKKVASDLTKISGKKAEVKNEEESNKIVTDCSGNFVVSSIKKSVKKKNPKLPFITSSLQQEASTKLGFSAKKTMQVAQKLYEGIEVYGQLEGLISYMRTDSTRLSNVFVQAANAYIIEQYGKEYAGFYREKKDANAQDAHEGIRPTNVNYDPESIKQFLTNDQFKLYQLIYARALASLMASAKSDNVTVTFTKDKYDFVATGSVISFDGYLKVYGLFEQTKDQLLPVFEEGKEYTPTLVEGKQHFTEPPLRYSEARLIKEMEELGIGRPSTYASIIDTIQQRGYVLLEKSSEGSKTKVFFPTERGTLTDDKLSEFFSKIINVKYTAEMESDLDKVAEGEEDNVEMLRDFYNELTPLVANAYEKMEKKEPEKVGESCPECGQDLVIREGRYGKFISCSGYPNCKYTRKIDNGEQKEEPVKTGESCPECGSELIRRKSRYGNYFIGCSNFPKCRYLKNEDNGEKKTTKKSKTATKTKKGSKKKA